MENFCKNLKGHAIKITNFEILKMLPLTKKDNQCYYKQILWYISKNKDILNSDIEKYWKARDYDHYTEIYGGASRLVCNIRYKNTGKIQVVLHNGLNYYYHLIFKKLREECEGQFECLRESLSTP